MNATARKMTKVIDELIVFFISAGSDGVRMNLEKQQDGYELSLESNYDPAQRNEGLEEFFWQLAGVSGLGQDTELHLIGQMVECRKLEIRDDSVSLVLYKARE